MRAKYNNVKLPPAIKHWFNSLRWQIECAEQSWSVKSSYGVLKAIEGFQYYLAKINKARKKYLDKKLQSMVEEDKGGKMSRLPKAEYELTKSINGDIVLQIFIPILYKLDGKRKWPDTVIVTDKLGIEFCIYKKD